MKKQNAIKGSPFTPYDYKFFTIEIQPGREGSEYPKIKPGSRITGVFVKGQQYVMNVDGHEHIFSAAQQNNDEPHFVLLYVTKSVSGTVPPGTTVSISGFQ